MDNVGNRTSVTNGSTTNYTTNNLNQYTTINGLSPTYDLNGNMLSDGYNTSIVYDYTKHPVRFDNADYTVEMRYDALGRRIEKKSSAKTNGDVATEKYVLDGARVISDADVTGAIYKDYIWGNSIDELLATAKGKSKKYDFYLNNSLGSITHIVNNKAELHESYKYKVYGTVTIFDKKGEIAKKSKEKNRYMFTGREYEPETRLYYYKTRCYSVEMGRFLEKDKNNLLISETSKYNYTNNNPMNFVDPEGLQAEHCIPKDISVYTDEKDKEQVSEYIVPGSLSWISTQSNFGFGFVVVVEADTGKSTNIKYCDITQYVFAARIWQTEITKQTTYRLKDEKHPEGETEVDKETWVNALNSFAKESETFTVDATNNELFNNRIDENQQFLLAWYDAPGVRKFPELHSFAAQYVTIKIVAKGTDTPPTIKEKTLRIRQLVFGGEKVWRSSSDLSSKKIK